MSFEPQEWEKVERYARKRRAALLEDLYREHDDAKARVVRGRLMEIDDLLALKDSKEIEPVVGPKY